MSNPDDAFRLKQPGAQRDIMLDELQAWRLAGWLNFLRLLHNIDAPDFSAAGLSCEEGATINLPGSWQRFQTDPPRWMMRADDQSAKAIWTVMCGNQIGPGNPTYDETVERVRAVRERQLAQAVQHRRELMQTLREVLKSPTATNVGGAQRVLDMIEAQLTGASNVL